MASLAKCVNQGGRCHESIEVFLLMIGILIVGLFSGSMIWSVMGIVSFVGLFWFLPVQSLEVMAWVTWSTPYNFLLVCLPLFLLLGNLISETGVSKFLFDGFTPFLARFRGGLLHSILAGAGVFAAASGAATADTAAMTAVAYKEMVRRGYDKKLTAAAIAAGGSVDILIPPSINMVIYSWITGESLGKLFLGGMIPGIIMVLSMMSAAGIVVTVNPAKAPKEQVKVPLKEKMFSILNMLPFICLAAIVLGSIYTGIATPTEAAGIGVFLMVIYSIAYRRFNIRILRKALVSTVRTTSSIMMIMPIKSSSIKITGLALKAMIRDLANPAAPIGPSVSPTLL